MNDFPGQEIPNQQASPQQVSVQPIITPVSSPAQKPLGQKRNFRKYINISTWIFLFVFLPITVLIFLSQNTVPGDSFYPVKRSLENVILAAASVSPSTRAAFRTDLADRRFTEAEKLLLASSSTGGLEDFVTGVYTAQTEVSAIEDPVRKQELQQKIQTSIAEYEKKLDQVKTKLVAREEAVQLALVPTATPALPSPSNTSILPTSALPPALSSSNAPTPAPTLKPKQVLISSPTPTSAPTAAPTPRPSASIGITTLIPTLTPTPTLTVVPTTVPAAILPTSNPTSAPTQAIIPTGGGGTIGTVDRVREYLHCLRVSKSLQAECKPPEISSGDLDRKTKPEKQNERKQNVKEKNNP